MTEQNVQIKIKTKLFYALVAFVLISGLFIPAAASAANRETPVVLATRSAGPAVVNISTHRPSESQGHPFGGMLRDPVFEEFFKDFFDHRERQQPTRASLGSGIIIDGNNGYILTNAHVIEAGGTITATLQDGREFSANIIGTDPETDLAVLKITARNLPDVPLGDSDDIMIGETVIAIGNPFGFSHTVTTGVVSATNRSIRADGAVFENFIQTDASINPGNSGGPLLNISGELIGINTAIYAKARGIGFAIPVNRAKRIVADLVRYGKVVPAWIGVTIAPIQPDVAEYLGIPGGRGVSVTGVLTSGPAEAAGIRSGDTITGVGAQKTGSTADFHQALRKYKAGDTVPVSILSNNKTRTVSVKAGQFPHALAPELTSQLLGIRLSNASDRYGNAVKGVRIDRISPYSDLYQTGVRKGDIILKMDDTETPDISKFYEALTHRRQKPSVVLLVVRSNRGYYVTVKLKGSSL